MVKNILIWISLAIPVCLSGGVMAQTPPRQAVAQSSPNVQKGLLDINRATHAQLTALGLSDAAAVRIMQKRPFRKKHELLSYKALDQDEFLMIRDKIYTWWPTRAMTTR